MAQPHLPAARLAGRGADVPAALARSFWLHGSAWHLPDHDNGEAFVRRRVDERRGRRDRGDPDAGVGRRSWFAEPVATANGGRSRHDPARRCPVGRREGGLQAAEQPESRLRVIMWWCTARSRGAATRPASLPGRPPARR
ncbi:hypothetical protein [Pseudonocardia kunmingensis]|uniref:hypothetical protein n=1 Tax=Pseudonocardia kunmingensis TaxID=630975 RepID=UPI001FE57C6F|nr:hypothetical protein [Pseudonocardia kunmingensis]